MLLLACLACLLLSDFCLRIKQTLSLFLVVFSNHALPAFIALLSLKLWSISKGVEHEPSLRKDNTVYNYPRGPIPFPEVRPSDPLRPQYVINRDNENVCPFWFQEDDLRSS